MMICVSILELTSSEIKLMATEEGVEYWAKMEKENLK